MPMNQRPTNTTRPKPRPKPRPTFVPWNETLAELKRRGL